MPVGEESVHVLTVTVAGAPLPEDVAPLLSRAIVEDSTLQPAQFELRFTDEQAMVLSKAGFTIGQEVELKVQSSEGRPPVPLLKGEVTTLETEISTDGLQTVVRGLDKAHRLFRGTRVEAYLNMTASDVVKKIAQRQGLTPLVDSTPGTMEHLTQANVSDWEFLTQLARQHGMALSVRNSELHFEKPGPARRAPSGSRGARDEPLVLQRGVNLRHLRATVTASGQVKSVEVRGWSPKEKREIVAQGRYATETAAPGGTTPPRTTSTFGASALLHSDAALSVRHMASSQANSLAHHLASGFAELEGTAAGNPRLRAGEAVTLQSCGDTFDGKYTLMATRHVFSPRDAYHTQFTAGTDANRELHGLTTPEPTSSRPGTRGLLPALVTNNNDPEKQGRVKVRLPTLSDAYESGWARVLTVGGGKERGLTVLPEVGDEVLVAFANDDPNAPYVLGGLFNGKDVPPAAQGPFVAGGEVTRRAWVSRKGMQVEFVEKANEQKLTISSSDNKQKIILAESPQKGITITSEGPLEVTAKQNVTVKTGTGNVELTGINVKIEAKGNLELKGATAKLQGQGTTEVSSSGVMTVRGSIVNIN